ncbi:unnamed protein product, partial [Durusdinium trenchii]
TRSQQIPKKLNDRLSAKTCRDAPVATRRGTVATWCADDSGRERSGFAGDSGDGRGAATDGVKLRG